MTGLTNPGLMTEHGNQHIESGEVEKSPVKISKTLNSEYMRNRNMIETMERNIKYVISQENTRRVEPTYFFYLYSNNVQSLQGVPIKAACTNSPRKTLCNSTSFAIQNLKLGRNSNAAYVGI